MAPMTEARAAGFAREWVAAWNGHDLDRILSHYAEDIVFASPFAVELTGAPDGVVRGKPALRSYFARGLGPIPSCVSQPITALPGAASVALHYRSIGGREAIEVMELGGDGLVHRVTVHYSAPTADR
jgi:SnoaL-like domain